MSGELGARSSADRRATVGASGLRPGVCPRLAVIYPVPWCAVAGGCDGSGTGVSTDAERMAGPRGSARRRGEYAYSGDIGRIANCGLCLIIDLPKSTLNMLTL
ncbi:hypothetical protein NOVOSPHI9U_370105 [Novosphingobium sp. 9U]|nr:hypothetical protein NOVOSPHI9U_370105 [Novosphingobium sp. 9U]